MLLLLLPSVDLILISKQSEERQLWQLGVVCYFTHTKKIVTRNRVLREESRGFIFGPDEQLHRYSCTTSFVVFR